MGVHVPAVPRHQHLNRQSRSQTAEREVPRLADDCTLCLDVAAAVVRVHRPELVLGPELDRYGEGDGGGQVKAGDTRTVFNDPRHSPVFDRVEVSLRDHAAADELLHLVHRDSAQLMRPTPRVVALK